MATIQANQTDQTILIFDSFYNSKLSVGADQFDIVFSYFKGVCNNTSIANNFTAILFRIAQDGNYNVLDLLATIQGNNIDKLSMNKVISYYLNVFKSKTALYGVGNIPNPNQSVQRNIVQ